MTEMVILPDSKNEKSAAIKFIKDHSWYSKGTILHCGEGRAAHYVRNGFAEYFEKK